jgi:hypothetical protein
MAAPGKSAPGAEVLMKAMVTAIAVIMNDVFIGDESRSAVGIGRSFTVSTPAFPCRIINGH